LIRQKEVALRQVARGRKLAECHRGLVAGVATGAVETVFEHLVAEGVAIVGAEVEVLEEVWDAGEEADALDAARFGLPHELVDELAAGSVAFDVGTDDDGPDLGEVRAVDVEGRTAEELMGVGFDNGKGANVGADFGVGPGKECAVVGEAVDQFVDLAGVLQLSLTRSEEDSPGLVAQGGGAGWEWDQT
jgi:hypothetical protein